VSKQLAVGTSVDVLWQGETVNGVITGTFTLPCGQLNYSIALPTGALFWAPSSRVSEAV